MSDFKKRTLDFLEIEWATYIQRFQRWPADEQEKRLKDQGYASLRDMLAHILAWWEEGLEIVLAVAEGREYARKKYDFDVFNAEAVAKYRSWDEAKLLARFEEFRREMGSSLRAMNEAAWENRRVQAWLNGIVIHHAREHLVALSRFLALDTLENLWSTYVDDFNHLDAEAEKEFLQRQGFETFHDLLAHVAGWWEEGIRIIIGIQSGPGFTWQEPEVDAFNVVLVEKYKSWSDAELYKHFESLQLELIKLTAGLPEQAFLNKDLEGWLAADVVSHYDEHAIQV
jgi:hypothetical protein